MTCSRQTGLCWSSVFLKLIWTEQNNLNVKCVWKDIEGWFWNYGTVSYCHSVRVYRDLLGSLNLTGQWRWQSAYRLVENNCRLIRGAEPVALVCRGVFRNCSSNGPWNFANTHTTLVRGTFSQIRQLYIKYCCYYYYCRCCYWHCAAQSFSSLFSPIFICGHYFSNKDPRCRRCIPER